MKVVPTYDFFNDNTPLLDVRSPAEFTSGHILGAISFPLFTDVERADVGTLYKQMSREAAIKRGLELIGPKMVSMIEQAESLNSRTFRLYCWRGGMRSRSVAWLLETYGFNCQVLEGGYKSYRKTTNELIEDELKLIVLSGLTGTRKTAILKALKEKGEQVIDLENLAGHQGSSFGNLENTEQPSTEQFHNLIFDSCRNLDSNRPVWIEDESFMIGRCALPQSLYNLKESSPHIVLDIPLEERIDHLVKGYGEADPDLLVEATERIRKKLGHERTDKAIELIVEGELKRAAEIILKYYDKNYLYSRSEKKANMKVVSFKGDQPSSIASTLIKMNYEEVS